MWQLNLDAVLLWCIVFQKGYVNGDLSNFTQISEFADRVNNSFITHLMLVKGVPDVLFIFPHGCVCWRSIRSAIQSQEAAHLRFRFLEVTQESLKSQKFPAFHGAQHITVLLFFEDTPEMRRWLESRSGTESFIVGFSWYILVPVTGPLTSLESWLRQTFIFFPAYLNSDVTLVVFQDNQAGVLFYELYRILPSTPLILKEIPSPTRLQPTEIVRRNFQLAVLNVTAVLHKDYIYDVEFEQQGENLVFRSGFSVDVLFGLQMMMNFSVRAIPAETWGHTENGTWKGSIAKVANGKANMGISSTALAPVRWAEVDFNLPTNHLWLSVYFVRPSVSSVRDIFLHPFSPWLWVAVVTLLVIMILNLHCIGTVHRRALHSSQSIFDFSDASLWAVATLSQKSYYREPQLCSERAVYLVGFFMGVLLYTGYSAVLVSELSVRVEPIRNLDELHKSGLRVAFVKYPITDALFSDPAFPSRDVRLLYKSRSQRSGDSFTELDVIKAIQKVWKEPFAYVASQVPVHLAIRCVFTPAQTCSFREINLPHTRQGEGTYVAKGSPIRRAIDVSLLKLQERGLVARWRLKWMVVLPPCSPPSPFNVAQPQELFSAFVLMCVAIIISIVLLFAEKFVFSCMHGKWNTSRGSEVPVPGIHHYQLHDQRLPKIRRVPRDIQNENARFEYPYIN